MSQENRKKELLHLFYLWVAITVVGVLVSVYAFPYFMPRPASYTLHLGILTMVVFSIAAAPVAAIVYAVVVYALGKWRYRGEGVPPAAEPLRGNSKVTLSWLVGSAVLTVFLLVWGLSLLATDMNASAVSNEISVNVTGQQWLWSFEYPSTETPATVTYSDGQSANLTEAVKSNILVLPVNRKVEFNVTSEDVVHGFWIVQMGVKVNANPGVITHTEVTPNKVGWFDIRCTEICGLNHAFMVTKVHVLSDTAFDKWLAKQPRKI
jgi:cytochrome c oxidase subunit II